MWSNVHMCDQIIPMLQVFKLDALDVNNLIFKFKFCTKFDINVWTSKTSVFYFHRMVTEISYVGK